MLTFCVCLQVILLIKLNKSDAMTFLGLDAANNQQYKHSNSVFIEWLLAKRSVCHTDTATHHTCPQKLMFEIYTSVSVTVRTSSEFHRPECGRQL